MALSQARVHATLPATDYPRAIRYYADTLGLKPTSEAPGGAFYDCGAGTRFLIFPSRGSATGTHAQLGFAVTDIESEVAALRAGGAVFEEYDLPGFRTQHGIATIGAMKSAFFKDSEGNLLGLVQLPPA